MSVVTNVLLAFSVSEEMEDAMESLNARVGDHCGYTLKPLDPHAGGPKAMEVNVWGAAFNYLVLDEFLMLVAEAGWREPDSVQVFVMEQEDTIFRLLNWPEIVGHHS